MHLPSALLVLWGKGLCLSEGPCGGGGLEAAHAQPSVLLSGTASPALLPLPLSVGLCFNTSLNFTTETHRETLNIEEHKAACLSVRRASETDTRFVD